MPSFFLKPKSLPPPAANGHPRQDDEEGPATEATAATPAQQPTSSAEPDKQRQVKGPPPRAGRFLCCACQHLCCFCHFLHRCECCVVRKLYGSFLQHLQFSVTWARYSWVDIATILSTTAASGILYISKPPAARSFAVTTANNDVVYPDFAYPLRKEIVPPWLAILLGPVVPVICILALQLRIRSFWDANNAIFGVLYSLSSSVFFQVILKWLIGGLRPHFLDVCKPDLSLAKNATSYNAVGFKSLYYTREVCTGDAREINDSLTSFPSGHTTAAFAGFVFLSLYMNSKFKIFSNRHTPMWKLLMFNAPILFATLIGGALTIDAYHNWYDIVAGATIGTFMAFCSYRMTYAAVFDWRYNHIPLNRAENFNYDSVKPGESLARHFGQTHLDNSKLHLF